MRYNFIMAIANKEDLKRQKKGQRKEDIFLRNLNEAKILC